MIYRAWAGSWRGAAAAALACAACSASAQEFACAALRPSSAQSPPYQRVPGQARCEGFFERQVSQPFVELVSLTRGAPDPAAAPLQLAAPGKTPARLVVHPLRSGPFYRVDALLEPGRPLAWDPGPMLAATGLALRDLGFLALVPGGDGAPLTVAPLAFTAQAEGEVRAVLRVSVAVSKLEWRRYQPGGVDAAASQWQAIPGPPLFPWARVPLTIAPPPEGTSVNIDVQARDAADKPLPLLRIVLLGPG